MERERLAGGNGQSPGGWGAGELPGRACPQQQDRDVDAVLDTVGGDAPEEVGEEAVAVGAHRHQVAALLAHPADDLVDRIAVGELGLGGDARGRELGAHALEVGGVLADLRADRVGAEGARRPAGRHVEEHDAAAGELGQPLDVLDDRAVRLRGVQGDEDGLVHGVVCRGSWLRAFAVERAARGRARDQPPAITCHAVLTDSGSPKMSMAVISSAHAQPAAASNGPAFHVPIRRRELANQSSGNIANGSCSASTTWLSVNRSVTLLSPRSPITSTAGRMASERVIKRRSHGFRRQCMKPSMTTWPASVPVIVLLWPLARRAIANSRLAAKVPRSGARVRKAIRIQSLAGVNVTTWPPDTVTAVLP